MLGEEPEQVGTDMLAVQPDYGLDEQLHRDRAKPLIAARILAGDAQPLQQGLRRRRGRGGGERGQTTLASLRASACRCVTAAANNYGQGPT